MLLVSLRFLAALEMTGLQRYVRNVLLVPRGKLGERSQASVINATFVARSQVGIEMTGRRRNPEGRHPRGWARTIVGERRHP